MALPVGIDLGTTNSLVCILRRGAAETVPVDGHSLLPSAVGIRPNGGVITGAPARAFARINPASVVTSAKRFIGDGVTTWELNGRTYSPVDISALVLQRLKQAAEEYLKESVNDAVITVPAYFGANQKLATKEAGERAGLNVLQLLPEPTAAAISYGLDKGKDQTILVYDLGGGTFDVSMLKVVRNSFEVIAVDGDFHLGGDDFDCLLAIDLCARLPNPGRPEVEQLRSFLDEKLWASTTAPLPIRTAAQQLIEAAERAKIGLSAPTTSTVQVTLPDVLGTPLDCEVTFAQYNDLIRPLVQRTIGKANDVLRAARMTVDDVDRVVLVGGSTRNRLVKESLTEAIKEPWTSERVDEAVAHGAALFANAARLVTPIKVRNVTAFNLGVRATKATDADHFQVLIPKNTAIPCDANLAFTTERDNQSSVRIAVYQGDSSHCSENTFIGGFLLEGVPASAAGTPHIEVTFHMDDSDILAVAATCKQQHKSQSLDVNMVSREVEFAAPQMDADIMFLIDTSGSMSSEIAGVKRSCVAFAEKVEGAGVRCRLGLVDFDKSGSSYKWEVFGPMEPQALRVAIEKLSIGRLGGAGCYIGEAATIPVIEAFARAFTDPNRAKIGILVSDEVGNDPSTVTKLIQILSASGVRLFAVGVPRSCHVEIAEATGGTFWDIIASRGDVDMSGVLDDIATEITNLALK